MTLNTKLHRTTLTASLLHVLFVSLFFNPIPAQALESGQALPNFSEFSKAVQNNQAGVLRGVYVPNLLAFPIIQQPASNAGYVSGNDGEITQFGMPSQFGNIGLLAHNNLSGRFFSQLAIGQEVRLVYGDGEVEYFVITKIVKYQALQPTSPYSDFRDLASDEKLTAEKLFNKIYRGDRHVTFQTCIEGNGNLSWGRLFVIAEPRAHYSGFNRFESQ